MRAMYIILLAAATLSSAIADVDQPKTTKTAMSHTLLSHEGDSTLERFLRSVDKEDDGNEDEEERMINDDAVTAFLHDLYNHPLLVKFESFMQNLQTKYWSLVGKTPEQVKKYLGLERARDIENHRNYNVWVKYKNDYEAKHL